ncbi:MAG: T9SS type A sorting domain-containing protein [Saprospiraceae bacterium]|nr:T9SS type A sorting domain-containing protein [Saprospiraceae bacterium]
MKSKSSKINVISQNLIFSLVLWLFLSFNTSTAQIQINGVVGQCEPELTVKRGSTFFGHLQLTASAMGTCVNVQSAFWFYRIDLMNDGMGPANGFDIATSPSSLNQYTLGDTVGLTTNPYADRLAHPFDATGLYPYGIHRIIWEAIDSCGNYAISERLFEIKDCKAPTPYCLTGSLTLPMPAMGCIDILAKDLDHGSFDNSTLQDNLKFYFNGDINETSMTICCDDFIDARQDHELRVEVEVWVEDGRGNRDYCNTVFIIQDIQDNCPTINDLGKIRGRVNTISGKPTYAELSLFNKNVLVGQSSAHEFNFSFLPFDQTYRLVPFDDSDHSNGVTTQDINLIKKYIIGQQTFSPYQILAADVNNTKSVTAADITEIRKLILGNQERFSKQNSNRFVPSLYLFTNPRVPYNAPGEVELTIDNTVNSHFIEFIKIKIGDVTLDSRAGGFSDQVKPRTSHDLIIAASPFMDLNENLISYPVTSTQYIQMQALQIGFDFNHGLEFVNVQSGLLNINDENIGTALLHKGIVRISWDELDAIECHPNEILFTLNFKKKISFDQISSLKLENSNMINEAYSLDGEVFSLKIKNSELLNESAQFIVSPNPINDHLFIQSKRSINEQVNLKLFDVQGREILSQDFKSLSGSNRVQLDGFSYNGIMIARLTHAGKTDQFKLIRQER